MDTPFIPANVRSVMLKASSILKPGGGHRGARRAHTIRHAVGFYIDLFLCFFFRFWAQQLLSPSPLHSLPAPPPFNGLTEASIRSM